MPGRGPIGALIGAIGSGVGAATEYRAHRKDVKAARTNAQDGATPIASSSQTGTTRSADVIDAPPSYVPGDAQGRSEQEREKKAVSGESSDSDSSLDSDLVSPMEDDEEAWDLDDLAESNEPPSYEDTRSADALADDVLVDRAPMQAQREPLALPVIIPQRRPRNKSRGFVRAYAPVLNGVGIEQETFLKFLKNFHTASQANPIFDAVIVAAGIAGFAPFPIAMAVTTAVQVIAGVGKEIDARQKTNTFLDRMNEEMFKPAGCFAMIIKHKSDQDITQSSNSLFARLGVQSEQVDFSTSTSIAKYDRQSSSESTSKLSSGFSKLRMASGKTQGNLQLPESAPLIYPAVDAVLLGANPANETFKEKAHDAKKFLASYADRRAQLAYARDDPTSAMQVPEAERQMKSKWSDPDHPMFNNGLVGLVSGGYSKPGERKAARREYKHERRAARREWKDGGRLGGRDALYERQQMMGGRSASGADVQLAGSSGGAPYATRPRRQKGGLIGGGKRIMRQDVLYLLIVPMPSESELREAREALEMAKAK
ncbi:hypothetical protein B0A48_06390 [Cryoendolithus antarcticus]|uniref:Uncharacterized protein n=1 Tax=Cryoendolithus antarcticus TaxID=1507870 RepID=A0A1V8TAX8_9PEZI|nr:hypothetical protein B0A48_06390 [Cryoendolithus antarcticus]